MLVLVGSAEERSALGPVPDSISLASFAEAEGQVADRYAPVIVCTRDPKLRHEEVLRIRRHRLGALRPVFVTESETADLEVDELTDGVITSISQAADAGAVIGNLLRTLPDADADLDPDRRLLHFLYGRRNRRVTPIIDWMMPAGHRYPLLDSLADPDVDITTWLQSLIRRDLVAGSSIVTRLRHCPNCGSAHLNFVDRCPNCHGLDIERIPFLHCFTCGNVAPMSQFTIGGRLQCPKCSSALRQIGVDYDRAIESYVCGSCSHTFSEPEVVGACLQCARETAPPDLVARDVRTLELTENGRLVTRSGRLADVFAALDDLNYSVPDEFFRSLDWFIKLGRRYKQITFSLLGVRFANVPALMENVGPVATMQVVENVAMRLRELLRDTDMSTRTTEEELWFLLPFTDSEGNKIVQRKIAAMHEQVTVPGGHLELQVGALTGAEAFKEEDARMFLARLSGTMV